MDGVVGVGHRFCPFIVDLREAAPGHLSIPTGQQSMRAIQRRIKRAVIITDPNKKDVLLSFLAMIAKIVPDLDMVHSMEEGVRKLGL
jgi:hydrogenase maturation factor